MGVSLDRKGHSEEGTEDGGRDWEELLGPRKPRPQEGPSSGSTPGHTLVSDSGLQNWERLPTMPTCCLSARFVTTFSWNLTSHQKPWKLGNNGVVPSKVLRGNSYQPRILCLEEVFFKNEGKLGTFSHK